MDTFIYTTTCNYSDLSPNGTLSNVGFLKMFQEAASCHSAFIGYGPTDSPKTNCVWIILSWKLKVFSRPEWNTKLEIKTWANIYADTFSYRDFEIYDESHNLLAIASSKWVIVDYITRHISKIPKEVSDKFNSSNKPVFGDKVNIKLKEPVNLANSFDYTVLRRDLDTNIHVNNLNYLRFAEEALPEDIYNKFEINNVEIMYKTEAKLNNTLSLNYSLTNDFEHIVSIKTGNTLNAIIKMWVD